MKRSTPMKRTNWHRCAPAVATAKSHGQNREQRLTERAQRAIKSAKVCDSVQAAPKAAPAHTTQALAAIKSVAHARPAVARARPRPKTKAQRNKHLRQMASGKPCLLQIPGLCTHDSSTVVCCHSNLSIHGKAGARKADDHYSAWGCAACHRWLDQGNAPRSQKTAAFMAAHLRQVLEWRAIAFDSSSDRKDRAAALWALERLGSLPILPPALDPAALVAMKSGVET